jgi:hypothetical protein
LLSRNSQFDGQETYQVITAQHENEHAGVGAEQCRCTEQGLIPPERGREGALEKMKLELYFQSRVERVIYVSLIVHSHTNFPRLPAEFPRTQQEDRSV